MHLCLPVLAASLMLAPVSPAPGQDDPRALRRTPVVVVF